MKNRWNNFAIAWCKSRLGQLSDHSWARRAGRAKVIYVRSVIGSSGTGAGNTYTVGYCQSTAGLFLSEINLISSFSFIIWAKIRRKSHLIRTKPTEFEQFKRDFPLLFLHPCLEKRDLVVFKLLTRNWHAPGYIEMLRIDLKIPRLKERVQTSKEPLSNSQSR